VLAGKLHPVLRTDCAALARCTAGRKVVLSRVLRHNYCYLPLYVFCGRHLLLARQRRANVFGSDGTVAELARIVAQIRRKWPRVRIILRADSGFSNDPLMSWCTRGRWRGVILHVTAIAGGLIEVRLDGPSSGIPMPLRRAGRAQ
jgi:hypothetical protein